MCAGGRDESTSSISIYISNVVVVAADAADTDADATTFYCICMYDIYPNILFLWYR